MHSMRDRLKTLAAVALLGVAAGSLGACNMDTILEVDRPGTLTTDELGGPTAIPLTINGIYGDFTEAMDNYVRYSGLFADEFILAGTFPTRHEVDQRQIVADNSTVTGELYEPLHTLRLSADTGAVIFESALGNEEYDQDLLQEGIAAAKYFGGFVRLLMSELYCEVPVGGGPYLLAKDRMAEAVDFFKEAQQAAADAGLDTFVNAALVGEARAHMFLGQYDQAEAAASRVSDFSFAAEYSANSTQQYNEVYRLTWGDGLAIRWTVGAGDAPTRDNEKFPYFEEWEALGRIQRNADLDAFDSTVDVHLQLEYDQQGSDIVVASKAEADLMLAEIAIRNDQFTTANTIVNGYRSAWELPDIDFADVAALRADLTANTAHDVSGLTDDQVRLVAMAREYSRELWLNGHRQGLLRRLFLNDGIDLYPDKPGAQICFPTPQQELDNNENESLNPDPTNS